jgi:hypothetical protein
MDPVSKLNQILAILQSKIATQAVKPSGSGRVEKKRVEEKKKKPGRQDYDELRKEIGLRAGAIDPDEPNRRHKTIRIFLETILLNELGEGLINDPQFYALVSKVQSMMETDPATAGDLDQLVQQLLDSSVTGRAAPSPKPATN